MSSRSECLLANSPFRQCLDRFSILDGQEDSDGLVALWPLLEELLKQPVKAAPQLIDILDTIANLLRASSGAAGDYGTLKDMIEKKSASFFTEIWPMIVRAALRMPEVFPDGSIPTLASGERAIFTRDQVACLVAHQFLCTFEEPIWRDGFYDYSIWYNSGQRHPGAVEMYLTALFSYFVDQGTLSQDGGEAAIIEYSLHAFAAEDMMTSECCDTVSLAKVTLVNVDLYSTEQQELQYQGSNGAVIVSANKDIGFGQSATQEELFVGNCPEVSPAVLLVPTLNDDQAFIIQGAKPMLRITSQRRDISWALLHLSEQKGGRMMFMDALEIDNMEDADSLPDLQPQNLNREIKKAYTAFSAWQENGSEKVVWAGIWGCGAFNGDPAVKMAVLWIAASLAGVELRIVCDPSYKEFSAKFDRFVQGVPGTWTVSRLKGVLEDIPKDIKRLETMDWMLGRKMAG